MTIIKGGLFAALSAAVLASSVAAGGEGILYSVKSPESNTCHLKFPAIREETLFSDRPVLKDPTDGDIIDYYGPCDHNPLGIEEIQLQRRFFLDRRRPSD